MIDPLTIAASAFAIKEAGGKELLLRLLGPTFDYFGQSSAVLAEKGVQNVGRVFTYATKKLGEDIKKEGEVAPRVLQAVMSESAFCEDLLMSEYFGGILAASRSTNLEDDQGASFAKLVSSMSILQVKAHYLLFKACRSSLEKDGFPDKNIGLADERRVLRMYIPISVILAFMPEITSGSQVDHIMFGLSRNSLIENEWATSSLEVVRAKFPEFKEEGIFFTPSGLGIELFIWAHGLKGLDIRSFIDSKVQFNMIESITITEGAVRIGTRGDRPSGIVKI